KPAPAAPAPVAPAPAAPAPAAPAPAAPAAVTSVPAPAAADSSTVPPAPAAPATRRLARELGVDLHKVTGTGPGKRITQDDVQAYVRAALKQSPPPSAATAGGALVAPPLPDFSQFGPVERQPLNKIMRTGATNLSLAWNIIPHVTQHELADVTDLEAARKRYVQMHSAKEGGPKITMTVLAMKAVVTTLKAFPRFNASYDAATGEVVLKRYYHIGVAVDTENGLMVPVIRNVDSKSVLQLAAEIGDLAQRARERKLTLADMQGGAFTITNLGGIGGTYFTPIVNYPEVAILGMSRTSQQMVVIDGKPEVRLMLPLSLSYDHRVINGADAARFIVKLSGLLSDPFQLLSEV
ncbi:MAG: 2-oxo acid dehydrogenase subunit E2, partial [Planctomycetaceae bacterium]